jgi:hypothetical protein
MLSFGLTDLIILKLAAYHSLQDTEIVGENMGKHVGRQAGCGNAWSGWNVLNDVLGIAPTSQHR